MYFSFTYIPYTTLFFSLYHSYKLRVEFSYISSCSKKNLLPNILVKFNNIRDHTEITDSSRRKVDEDTADC